MPEKLFEDRQDAYSESQVIMTAVRLIAPFAMVYGIYLTFHGAHGAGGAFQGGTIVGGTILLLAFAFGVAPVRYWLAREVAAGLMVTGVIFLGVLGFSGIVMGGQFLDYQIFYALGAEKGVKWGIEAMEIGGIFFIVAGAIVGLFFIMAAGFNTADSEAETRGDGR